MREPRTNWGSVCPVHEPRPDPSLATRPPAAFVGRFVKIAFPVREHPYTLRRSARVCEHMWVEVLDVLPDGTLVGRLDNDPVYDVGFVCGNLVPVRLDQIEAVYED